ncbi:MAG: hypothetical protein ABL867_03165 [Rickettsiales bacterium]
MLHDQNDQNGRISYKRALFIAPLSAFPITLVFGIVRDSSINDFRSILAFLGLALFPAIAALYSTVIYYLFEVTVFGIVLRLAPKLLSSLGRTILVGLISAEVFLWIQYFPYWDMDYKNMPFFSVMFAVCGLATGLIFHRLSHMASTR